ncbi:MAG: hypothetical protein WKG07_48635 [Hymenobacter sp.]
MQPGDSLDFDLQLRRPALADDLAETAADATEVVAHALLSEDEG